MCLAIPGKVVSVADGKAIVSYGDQNTEAIVKGMDIYVGDYVLVQFKIVVEKLEEKDALEAIKNYQDLRSKTE